MQSLKKCGAAFIVKAIMLTELGLVFLDLGI